METPPLWHATIYCRGPPHMGLRDYGGLRTGGEETEGLQALGRLNANRHKRRFKLLRTIHYSSVHQATATGKGPTRGRDNIINQLNNNQCSSGVDQL